MPEEPNLNFYYKTIKLHVIDDTKPVKRNAILKRYETTGRDYRKHAVE